MAEARDEVNPLIFNQDVIVPPEMTHVNIRAKFIKDELRRNEDEFMVGNEYNIWVGSWNVNGRDIADSLLPWLQRSDAPPDFILVALQEIDRRPEAYVKQVSVKENFWNSFILENLQHAFGEEKYVFVTSRSLIGTYVAMYARSDRRDLVSNITTAITACGLMGVVGNKGAAAIRAKIHKEYVCFVGCHLAPHQPNAERRNQDYVDITRRLAFPSAAQPKTPPDWSVSEEISANWNETRGAASVNDCSILIWAGDLNYRIDREAGETLEMALNGQYDGLLERDQLRAARLGGKAFVGFQEAPIAFAPTYKYALDSDSFDDGPQPRPPAWTDRIQWREDARVSPTSYGSVMAMRSSDHKPVHLSLSARIRHLDGALFDACLRRVLSKLDAFENETIPITSVSNNVLHFGQVVYHRATMLCFFLYNTGSVIANYSFLPPLGRRHTFPAWISVSPAEGILLPGTDVQISVTLFVSTATGAMDMNDGRVVPADILILHIDNGRDHFLSIEGEYRRTSFGGSLLDLFDASLITTLPDVGLEEERVFLGVPPYIVRLAKLIREGRISNRDVFLESGEVTRMQTIQDCLELDLPFPESLGDSIGVASAGEMLLKFLDSLVQPVIPYGFFQPAMEVADDANKAFDLLQLLPQAHQQVFEYIRTLIWLFLAFERSCASPSGSSQGEQRRSVSATDFARVFAKVLLKPPPPSNPMYKSRAQYEDMDGRRMAFVRHFFKLPRDSLTAPSSPLLLIE